MLVAHRGAPWSRSGHRGEAKHSRDVEFLNNYADTQWEVSGILDVFSARAPGVVFQRAARHCLVHWCPGSVSDPL